MRINALFTTYRRLRKDCQPAASKRQGALGILLVLKELDDALDKRHGAGNVLRAWVHMAAETKSCAMSEELRREFTIKHRVESCAKTALRHTV